MVDCAHAGLTQIPKSLPIDTDWLILSGNNISSLNQEIVQTAFFTHLTKLYISSNNLDNISNLFEVDTCSRLSFLDISNNNLSTLPRNVVNISSLRNLWLGGNSFKCICDNFWMRDWLRNSGIVDNYTKITCIKADAKEIRMIDMDSQEVGCPLPKSTLPPEDIWKPIGFKLISSFHC